MTNLSFPPPAATATPGAGAAAKASAPQHAAVDARDSGGGRALLGPTGAPRHLYAAKFGAGSMQGCIFAGGSGEQPVFCTYQQVGRLPDTRVHAWTCKARQGCLCA